MTRRKQTRRKAKSVRGKATSRERFLASSNQGTKQFKDKNFNPVQELAIYINRATRQFKKQVSKPVYDVCEVDNSPCASTENGTSIAAMESEIADTSEGTATKRSCSLTLSFEGTSHTTCGEGKTEKIAKQQAADSMLRKLLPECPTHRDIFNFIRAMPVGKPEGKGKSAAAEGVEGAESNESNIPLKRDHNSYSGGGSGSGSGSGSGNFHAVNELKMYLHRYRKAKSSAKHKIPYSKPFYNIEQPKLDTGSDLDDRNTDHHDAGYNADGIFSCSLAVDLDGNSFACRATADSAGGAKEAASLKMLRKLLPKCRTEEQIRHAVRNIERANTSGVSASTGATADPEGADDEEEKEKEEKEDGEEEEEEEDEE